MRKLIQGLGLMVLFLLISSCVNKDYDLDQVDGTVGFGSGGVTLPNDNSTAEIILDDLLNISNSDIVITNEQGDYLLSKGTDEVDPVKVTIDPIDLVSEVSEGLSLDIDVPQELTPFMGMTIDVTEYNIAADGRIAWFGYEFDAPEAVKDLEFVGLGINGEGCDFIFNLSLPMETICFEHVDLFFPDRLDMTWLNPIEGAVFDSSTNTLHLKDYVKPGDVQLRFKVTRIRVGHTSDDNYADFTNGHIAVKGTISADVKVASLKVPSESHVSLSSSIDFSKVSITSAHGIFDPDIDMLEVGTVEITSIPDFLLDEEVVVDLDNPQIWMTIHSTMPLGGKLKGKLTSDCYPQGIILDTPGRIVNIKGSTDASEVETRVLLCRYNPGIDTNEIQVIEDENLSKLVQKMENGMKLEFLVTEIKADQEQCTVLLGHEYHLTPAFQFAAPLAFGPQAAIVYSDVFKDWNGDINKLDLSKGTYVHVMATAVNKVPANLEVDVAPLGVDGQVLNELAVELIKNDAAGSNGSPVESPIEVKITDTTGNGLKKLDGISLHLKASSNEQLRGETLNKQSQTLVLKDIQVRLVGKIRI